MLAALVILVVAPLLLIIVTSFKPSGFIGDAGATLHNYVSVYTDARFFNVLGTTVVFAVGSTVVALTITIGLAWLIERTDMPFRKTARVLAILPAAVPPMLFAVGWSLLLDERSGVINELLRGVFSGDQGPLNINSLSGMILVQSFAMVPVLFMIISPALRNLSGSLESAGLTCGASGWTTFRKITLPLLTPSVLASAMYGLIVGLVIFDIPGTLGMPVGINVFATEVYQQLYTPSGALPEYGTISALTMLFLTIALFLTYIYRRQTKQDHKYVVVSGKDYRRVLFRLGRGRPIALLLVSLYYVICVGFPLAVLTWTSFMPYIGSLLHASGDLLTFSNYATLFSNSTFVGSIWNTVVIAIVSATACSLLATGIAWYVVRGRGRGRAVVDYLSFLPVVLTGVLIAIALIFMYLTIPIGIYGTIWIIALAYTTVYLSFGSRVTGGVMRQLSPDLEEAGYVSGARWSTVSRRIVVPLMLPAVLGVWIWVAAHASRELSAALMLQSGSNSVISTVLWDTWTSGRGTVTAAIGVLLMVVLVILISVWQTLSARAEEA